MKNLTKVSRTRRNKLQKIGDIGFYQEIKTNHMLYLMLLPGLITVLLFSYGPMFGLSIAFLDYNPVLGIANSKFVGLKHFIEAVGNKYFQQAFINTIIIKIGQTLVTFPASIILALLLNEAPRYYKRAVQTATIFPYFISWIVVATMFRSILSPNNGIINEILINWFGKKDPIVFLSNPKIFRFIIIFQDSWKMGGFWALIYLSAITSIDPTIYEVATVDGAGRWRQMWHVTLPGIRPTVITLFILLMGYIVVGPFEQVFSQYSPTVYSTGDIVETLSFRLGVSQQKYGYATAVGLMQSIMASTLVIVTNYVTSKFEEDALF